MYPYDLVIIGGGAAGMCVAIEAKKQGIDKILLLEREAQLGYQMIDSEYIICQQTMLTGKEYRLALLEELENYNIEIRVGTTVLKIEEDNTVACIYGRKGIEKIKSRAIVIATGAREMEINPFQLNGDQVKGLYTIRTARKTLKSLDKILGVRTLIVGTTELERVADLLQGYSKQIVGIVDNDLTEARALKLSTNYYEGYELVGVYGKEKLERAVVRKGAVKETIDCDTIIFAQPLVCDDDLARKSGLDQTQASEENYQLQDCMIFVCGRCMQSDQEMAVTRRDANRIVQMIKDKLNI